MTYPINLPSTTFPMKGNLPRREPEFLQFWRELDLYAKIKAEKRSRTFIVHDGPPYANGDIHLGHAFDKILKDMINKTKLLENYNINFIPGWDCHGLPIELNVEKKLGKPKGDQIEKFISACRDYAFQQITQQKLSFQRLGVLGDWEQPYRTLDYSYEAKIVEALGKVLSEGYLVSGFKPVHWCTNCKSALAEAEVEYQDKLSPAIDVKFELQNSPFGVAYPVIFPIWTTTPWTLPSNEAVCLHPELNYLLVEVPEHKTVYLINRELMEEVLTRYQAKKYQVLKNFLGKELENLRVKHPFLPKTVPVILGNHVTNVTGTGIVHTAPAHGLDDYKVGLAYRLPIESLVDASGIFAPEVPYVGNFSVSKANQIIIELLREKRQLLNSNTLVHSYPHCWRHKSPLLFRATKQWFISMELVGLDGTSLKQKALQAIKQVKWYPSSGEESLRNMVEKRYDWCISRQRYCGVPLTLLVHRDTGKIHPQMSSLIRERIVPAIRKEGVIYWYHLDPTLFLQKYSPEGAEDYQKVTDTLDVWFDSGVSHYAVLMERNLPYPADLYTEGVDQYRGWFQSSLLTALAINGTAPYKQILTHGFTVDEEGHKMSKSLGNVISPQEIVKDYGADLLRLWVASSFLHDDIKLSKGSLARISDSYRFIRNTIRFLLGNLSDFDPLQLVPLDQLLPLDRYLLEALLDFIKLTRKAYQEYRFYQVVNELQAFLSHTVSSFYFSVIKDRLYTLPSSHPARRSAQTVLWYYLEGLVRIIAPSLSFTAEEVWQEMRKFPGERKDSVFLTSWQLIESLKFDSVASITNAEWQEFFKLRETVNQAIENLRIQGEIGSSLAVKLSFYVNPKAKVFLDIFGTELRFLLIVSEILVLPLERAPLEAFTYNQDLKLLVAKSEGKKCARCWHLHSSVGKDLLHQTLCFRCVENLYGNGEKRLIG